MAVSYRSTRVLLFIVLIVFSILVLAPQRASAAPISQWATSATATSEWSNPSWAAMQATGEPDTYPSCGDIATAWASATADLTASLTLYYDFAVFPSEINIYQTYRPGSIISVEAIPHSGSPIVIPNSSSTLTTCPNIFTLPVSLPGNPVIVGLRINFDQNIGGVWNEIDAVELIGEPVGPLPPVANNDTFQRPANDSPLEQSPSRNVLTNDSDLNGDPLTAQLVTNAANGTVTLNPNGQFRYVPNAGFIGLDSFTYVANDGTANSNVATVSITIDTNQMPIAQPDTYTIDVNTPLPASALRNVLANDTDPEAVPLTATLVSGPSHAVTFDFFSNGQFSYTPRADFIGQDSFVYRASDGRLLSLPTDVTIIVNMPSPVPTATPVPDTSVANLTVFDDTDGGTILPTFNFTMAVDSGGNMIPVEWFNLVITDSGGVLVDAWLPYDRYCEGIICTITLTTDLLPAGLLTSGYTWKVRTWHPSTGMTDFSTDSGFEVEVDPPGVPSNVDVSTSGGRIVISFDYDPKAAWYHIVIEDASGSVLYDAWHSVDEITCDESRCSFVLPALPGVVDAEGGVPGLLNGSYALQISAWGPGGFNGGNPNSATNENFSVNVSAAGLAGIPDDFAITNTNSGSPTFRWIPAENATFQLLWIGTPTGLPGPLTSTPILTYHMKWYAVDAMDCREGEDAPCLFTPQDVFLANGKYEYWVLSWGPAGQSQQGAFIGWIQGPRFNVAADEPTPPEPMTPTGTLNKGVTNFTWDHVPGVTWYNLWVGTRDGNQYSTAYNNWHRATEIGCIETGTCTVDPDDLYLPEDDYIWYIQSYNPAYIFANVLNYWSEPPGAFTVDRP